MEPGSIQAVTERLKSWCIQNDRGLARVEWDSAYARRDVVDRLKSALSASGVSVVEFDLPPGESAPATAERLIAELRSRAGAVVSITGVEWAFPERGSLLATLAAIGFQRETLASLPVRQIWWIPSHLTEQFILAVPDLDSWFRLRIHLTEIPPRPMNASHATSEAARRTVSVDEARALARRFWERIEAARDGGFPEDRIWTELAEPAVEALQSAGLQLEADAILARTSGARERMRRELVTLREARGEDDPEVLWPTSLLARFLGDQGKFAGGQSDGEQLLDYAMTLLRPLRGEEDPGTLRAFDNVARTLELMGDLPRARKVEEQALTEIRRVRGEEHPDTLVAANRLAVTLNAQGELAGARKLGEWVQTTSRRLRGEEHPDTLTAMNNLALTLKAQGDLAGAWKLQEQVLQARHRLLGSEHPDTLTAMNNLAVTLRAQGDLARARKLQEEVLQARRRLLGSEHPDTLMAMNNLAGTLKDQGDLVGARKLRGQALELRRRLLGAEHPATLNAMNNLAILLSQTGDREGAIQLLRECLPARREVLGENHPDTIATAEFLKRLEASHEPPDLI